MNRQILIWTDISLILSNEHCVDYLECLFRVVKEARIYGATTLARALFGVANFVVNLFWSGLL